MSPDFEQIIAKRRPATEGRVQQCVKRGLEAAGIKKETRSALRRAIYQGDEHELARLLGDIARGHHLPKQVVKESMVLVAGQT